MDEELLKQLHDAIDASNKAIEGIEESVNQLAELTARRARLIASRDALLPTPGVAQKAKVDPSDKFVARVFRELSVGNALTFAGLTKAVAVHGATTKPEVTAALRRLEKAGRVTREGSGKATRYVAVVASE